ncbi:hypothetical protein ISCGN_024631 [Ixodes scapularis]
MTHRATAVPQSEPWLLESGSFYFDWATSSEPDASTPVTPVSNSAIMFLELLHAPIERRARSNPTHLHEIWTSANRTAILPNTNNPCRRHHACIYSSHCHVH